MLSTPQHLSPALTEELQNCRTTSLNPVGVHIVESRISGKRNSLQSVTEQLRFPDANSLLDLFFTAHSISSFSLQSMSVSGLAVATLTLILYTIGLHITTSAGVSHLGAVVLGILHAIPALGILAITSVELAFVIKSPAVAISIIISCFLPTMIAISQYLRVRSMKAMIGQLPMTVPGGLQLEPARLEFTGTNIA
ncbi:hypothetical protein BDR04DRAFT_1151319 [Suillus decipiens]|nr:hypothetical protein BDR04DRAFT_1151319 [Suillus decipiens]